MTVTIQDAPEERLLQTPAPVDPWPKTVPLLPVSDTSFNPQDRYYRHSNVVITRRGIPVRTYETWERPQVPGSLEDGSKFFYVKPQDSFRADIVAQRTLGDSALWWWILFSNNMIDITQLIPGITLQISRPPSERIDLSPIGAQ